MKLIFLSLKFFILGIKITPVVSLVIPSLCKMFLKLLSFTLILYLYL